MRGEKFRKLSVDTWAKVRREVENGASFYSMAKIHGVSPTTISQKAKSQKWNVNNTRKIAKKVVGNPRQVTEDRSVTVPTLKESDIKYFANSLEKSQDDTETELSVLTASLSELGELPPAEFQAKSGKVMQALFAAGLQNVPIPQSVKELTSVFNMWRAMTGLDVKDKPQAATLIQPLKAIRRRPVVEAVELPEPEDLDGFVI